MRKLIFIVLFSLLFPLFLNAAELICFENFEDQDFDACNIEGSFLPLVSGVPTDCSLGSDCAFEGPGYNSSNYAFVKGSDYNRFTNITFTPVSWSPDQAFYRAKFKFSTVTCPGGDAGYRHNIKFFYPKWSSGNNAYVAISFWNLCDNDNTCTNCDGVNTYLSFKNDDGAWIATRYGAVDWGDGNWHVLEIWIDFINAKFKMWFDSNLVVNEDFVDTTWDDNAFGYWSSPNNDSEEADTFKLWWDEWELWECNDGDSSCENRTPTAGSTDPFPTLTSATISADGTTLTLVFSEAVTQGAGYADSDWDVDCTTAGTDISVTYADGDASTTHVYSLGSTVNAGDSCDIDFDGSANSEEDSANQDLAEIKSGYVNNNSIQGSTQAAVSASPSTSAPDIGEGGASAPDWQ